MSGTSATEKDFLCVSSTLSSEESLGICRSRVTYDPFNLQEAPVAVKEEELRFQMPSGVFAQAWAATQCELLQQQFIPPSCWTSLQIFCKNQLQYLSKDAKRTLRLLRHTLLEEEEEIFMLYDKTLLGDASAFTLFTSAGVRSRESIKKLQYAQSPNKFVSWKQLANSSIIYRREEKIFMDHEYIMNGFTNSRILTLLLSHLRSTMREHPFFMLHTEQLNSAVSFSSSVVLSDSDVKNLTSTKRRELFGRKTSKGEENKLTQDFGRVLVQKGPISICERGFVIRGKQAKDACSRTTLFTWKELSAWETAEKVNGRILINGLPVLLWKRSSYELLMELHQLVEKKRKTQEDVLPPSYALLSAIN